MNMMSLVLVAIVAFTYFGGQNVPKVLKDNKQMILGVFVGVLLHQFMGVGVEGITESEIQTLTADEIRGLEYDVQTKTVTIGTEDFTAIVANKPGNYCTAGGELVNNDNVLQCNNGENFVCPDEMKFRRIGEGFVCE